MARNNDAGPYAIDNVRICSNKDNAAESYALIPAGKRRLTSQLDLEPDTRLRAFYLKKGGLKIKQIAKILSLKSTTAAGFVAIGRKIFNAANSAQ